MNNGIVAKSGYKGVYKTRAIKSNRYEACLTIYSNDNNVKIKRYIGTFDTPQLAHIARIKYIDSLK